jgi:hypothetical protein
VIRVARVRTFDTITEPGVRALVLRAVEAVLPRLPPRESCREIVQRISQDSLGVFVGWWGDEPKTLLIAEVPTSCFQLAPMVLLSYSEARERELVVATAGRAREWLIACGFKYADVQNLRHTDRSMCRGCAHFGTPERIGGVIRFTWRGDE